MQGDLSEFLKLYNNIESILNTNTNITVLTPDFSNKKYNNTLQIPDLLKFCYAGKK
jgi:hypothetical protein